MQQPTRTFAGLALLVSALAGCGHGSGMAEGDAMLTVALTDGASDDIESFTLDITSIQLMKRGGGVASVLAAPVTVDLVTLQELSQILEITTLPPGFYTGADVT